MKYARKMLSLLLVLVLTVTVLPAAVSADSSTDRLVHSYEELVTELAKPHDPTVVPDRIVICPADFTWPAGPATLELKAPNEVYIQVGMDTRPELGRRWIIPDNVTVNQQSSLSLTGPDAGLVINGRWNGEPNGTTFIEGSGAAGAAHRIVVNGTYYPITTRPWNKVVLELNGTMIVEGQTEVEELVLGPDAKILGSEGGGDTVNTLLCKKNIRISQGSPLIEVPMQVGHFGDTEFTHRISGNLAAPAVHIFSPAVLESGAMNFDLSMDERGTLELASGCTLDAANLTVTGDAPMTLNGTLHLGVYGSVGKLHLGRDGELYLAPSCELYLDLNSCRDPRISGTGRITAKHMGGQPAAIYPLTASQQRQELIGDDDPERVALRREYIDETVRLERSWMNALPGTGFIDVPAGAYYARAVNWAVRKGITSGTTPSTFDPNVACTRAQAVSFLWRAAGRPAPDLKVNPFLDVPASAYYADAVLWAVEKGITKGLTPTAFGPNKVCTRAQIVSLLWNAADRPSASIDNPFLDVPAGKYYEEAVLWAVEAGVTKGVSPVIFSPNAQCTRAQIACFLYNFCNPPR